MVSPNWKWLQVVIFIVSTSILTTTNGFQLHPTTTTISTTASATARTTQKEKVLTSTFNSTPLHAPPLNNKNLSAFLKKACLAHLCLPLAILLCPINYSYAVESNPSIDASTSTSTSKVWELANGQVETPDPLTAFPPYILRNPTFLGSGGGGAVFSYHDDERSENVAIKISWVRSARSVKRECDVLQLLEKGAGVEGGAAPTRNVEICLGKEQYDKDPRRVMIALQPVVDNFNAVSSVQEVNNDRQQQLIAVDAIVRTMVDMLAANVVTTDVQPLIHRGTGEVLFIDMTEARVMGSPEPSFLDLALASSFCSEMAALIPSSSPSLVGEGTSSNSDNDEAYFNALANRASATLLQELKVQSSRGVKFSEDIYGILQSQSIFVSSPETLEYIESKSSSTLS